MFPILKLCFREALKAGGAVQVVIILIIVGGFLIFMGMEPWIEGPFFKLGWADKLHQQVE